MGKLITSGDFLDLGVITSRTEDANFPDDNLGDYWHAGRRFRANDVIANDWLFKLDLGAAKSVAAVIINNVNFDHIQIYANAADGAFPWAGHDSGSLTVSLDERVNRYKIIYVPAAAFTFRWLAGFIPAGTVAVGDYTTKWEASSVVILDSLTEFSHNMSREYSRKAQQAYKEIAFPHGGFEIVNLGDSLQWVGTASFGPRTKTDEADLWTLNQIAPGSPMIFYENNSDTSKVYLCVKDDAYEGTVMANDLVMGNTIRFRELI